VNIEELDKLASHLMPSAARLVREAATELTRLHALESEARAAGFIGEDGKVTLDGVKQAVINALVERGKYRGWASEVAKDSVGYLTAHAARDAKEIK
jgi:hypothetical protein